MHNSTAIGPLTKVSLALAASEYDPGNRQPAAKIQFEFIYGIGTEGLSAFEKELHGLLPGARMKTRIEIKEMESFFEHLRCRLSEAVKIQPPFNLAIEVLSVRPATDRELVHALANRDSGGCDCGCGCAC